MDSFDEIEYLEKTVENPDKDSENNGRAVDDEDRDSRRHSRRRSDEADHHSKRARSESRHEKERDRDRDRSRRGSSHHRSSPDGRDRHRSSERRERERSERNGRETERDRKESDRDREKSKDRERSRRSRSRSERRKSPDRHRESRDRDLLRERERERERELREKERRFKERKEENAEPEADPERDQRTVFAYQICLRADERNVYEFFSRAGKVRDVRLIMDRNSRRSKGVGYIEFYDAMSVPMAIALSGQLLLGQPVMVKPSEAEKNLVQSSAGAAGAVGGVVGPYSGGARRLYVGNLHFNMTEDQLRQVFEPFGPVELVQLPTDPETGQCKGFGFVQFAKLEDARSALNLNGNLEIAGRTLKVSAVTDQAGMQEFGANAADFDDDDGGGISLNARSRVLLMQKLDRSNTPSSVSTPAVSLPGPSLPASLPPAVAQTAVPAVPAVPAYIGGLVNAAVPAAPVTASAIGTPSECLLLINMFDPKTETEPDFDLDIKDDVQDECAKFGTVRHIFVDKNSAGHVYLRFDTVTSAKAAQLALHGRWFAGKMITATYMPIPTYEAKFPDSRL